jgi:hypothetical protein
MFKVVVVIAVLASPIAAYAQGSAGTGSTSTGLGAPTGPAGPGIRRGGWTQQPGAATNPVTGPTNLSPSQKNSAPECTSNECAALSKIDQHAAHGVEATDFFC